MELTITFFIKFTLVVYFISALYFILLSLLRLSDKFNRDTIFHFFLKGLHFSLLSCNYPIRRADCREQ